MLTHQDRCQLTFLAIQAPGISKYCGICGKQFLTVQWVQQKASLREGDGNTSLTPKMPNLAYLLLAACELCVYCGGKYVS